MSNDYFNHNSPLSRHTLGRAEAMNAIFNTIASGFEKLPDAIETNQGRVNFAVDGGAADVYTAAMPKTWTSYVNGATLLLEIGSGNTNTGAATLNVDGLGARSIKTSAGEDPAAGDLVAGKVYHFIYDSSSSQFNMLSYASQDTVNISTVAGIAADVTSVAGVSSDVTTVAGVAANVTTVAGVSADVTTVATNIADVSNVSDNMASILDALDGALTPSNNLSDLDNAATARSNLNVDVAGTDNSTDVTLSGSGSYLSLTDQDIQVDLLTDTDIAGGANINASKLGTGAVSNTEFNHLNGVTSAIQTQINTKAPLASPTFTGNPTAPTQSAGDNSTKLATTAYVDAVGVGLIPVSSTVASSDSAIDIVPSGYTAYRIRFEKVLPATANQDFHLQLSEDSGSTFENSNYYWQAIQLHDAAQVGNGVGQIKLNGSNYPTSNDAGLNGVNGYIDVILGDGTSETQIFGHITYGSSSADYLESCWISARRADSAAAVDQLRFFFESGNIASGTFHLYGWGGA